MLNRIESDTDTVHGLSNSEKVALLRRQSLSQVILAFVLVGLLSSVTEAYPNPRYITYVDSHTRAEDTVAVLICSPAPSYLKTSRLEIKYVAQQDHAEELSIRLTDGQLCDVRMDQWQQSLGASAKNGDTLRCAFDITPTAIGTIGLGFAVERGEQRIDFLPFGFVIDERGQAATDAPLSPTEEYGLLGLLPEFQGDTLFFTDVCCLQHAGKVRAGLCISATVSPPPRAGVRSIVDISIMSPVTLDGGLYYKAWHNHCIGLQIDSTIDWPQSIPAGDTIRLRMTIWPENSGVAEAGLIFDGLSSDTLLPTRRTKLAGRVHERFSLGFVFDDQLSLSCYTKNGDSPRSYLQRGGISLHDKYRLDGISAKAETEKTSVIESKNYRARVGYQRR